METTMEIPGKRIDTGETVYTAPFERGGDGMFLRAQLISKDPSIASSSNLVIVVQTRNTEDDWGSPATAGTMNLDVNEADGTVTELHVPPSSGASGIEEQLRLKISGASAGWALIRVFQPLFYDTASS